MTSLDETRAYLASRKAAESLGRDPYYPKWASPWWRMTLLWELGLAERIPREAVGAMVAALKIHYTLVFPVKDGDLPPGVDPHRGVPCHCAVGTMHQVLRACGVDVDSELAWMKAWLLRHQLPDGGLNCYGAAYTGSRKSSMVSTLPPLEAVLFGAKTLSPSETLFVDRGARYLLDHKLFRSSSGAVIDPSWLELCFPRFYHYDVLRGLSFLARWSAIRNKPLPHSEIAEATAAVKNRLKDGQLSAARVAFAGERSLNWNGTAWVPGPAALFPLLEEASRVGPHCSRLTEIWTSCKL